MKKTNVFKFLLGSLLLSLLALPGAAIANEVIADVVNKGDALYFYPVSEFQQIVLTVTGPCDYRYREVITGGGSGRFSLDQTTIDGVYRFNLSRELEIDEGIIKALLEARQEGNQELPKQLCRDGKLPGPPANQAAGFHVFEGKIIYDPEAFEKAAGNDSDQGLDARQLAALKPAPAGMSRVPTKDFVIIDDLIVDGSACIGFDCVNGESFGFDTIRVKENNLRIKFDDTSVAASFPRNDWQLTANDSANGGASKFSIDDISGNRTPFTVEANARSHSLYVDDGGRIGNRTSTPSTEIHTIDGDTPTLRLQQDGSSGFAPQTWDVAGNETNFFIRDVTNGSTLPFRIRPGAPTSSIFVDVDGDVGMGTASPVAALDIERSGTNVVSMQFSQTGGVNWSTRVTGSGFYRISDVDSSGTDDGVNELNLDGTGNLTITGQLITQGPQCPLATPCDGVFAPDFEVESIEEHAAFMWENSYLPSVGQTLPNKPLNLSQRTGRILNELEKAHIYIEQLNDNLKNKDETISDLQERLARLEGLLVVE